MIPVDHSDIPRRIDADGRVWFTAASASELLLRGFDITALNIDAAPDIDIYNAWCERKDKTSYAITDHSRDTPDNNDRLNTWWLTDEFRDLPVRETILSRCTSAIERDRAQQELDLFDERGLFPVLRVMFMLIDHFRRNNIVWGVGRGSSVSSFVLYKIGVHKLNPIVHGLEISEFLRD